MQASCDKQHGGEANTGAKHGNASGSSFLDGWEKRWTAGRDLTSRGEEAVRSEDLDRAFQRLVHAPGERDADKGPEQRRLGIQPALVDAERAGLHRSRALRTRRL